MANSITVTTAELPELLQDFPLALKKIQRLDGLEGILNALPQPPIMGAVTLRDQQLSMLEHLWSQNFIDSPPWCNR